MALYTVNAMLSSIAQAANDVMMTMMMMLMMMLMMKWLGSDVLDKFSKPMLTGAGGALVCGAVATTAGE